MPLCEKSRLAAFVTALLAGCSRPALADLILLHATVHTLDDKQPAAEAIAVRDGRIAFVGSSEKAQAFRGPATRVIDLAGKTVVPGFIDSHAHLSAIGERQMTLNLEGARSLQELLETVGQQAEASEPGQWIVGRGWMEAQWTPPDFPTRQDLDGIAPRNPVWLVRIDGHAGVANSLALRTAGINSATKDPPGGEILRDPRSGEPTGMLVDRAQEIIAKFLPRQTPERIREALLLGARRSAQLGWTQVSIAGNTFAEIEILLDLYASGEIPIRVYDAVRGPGPDAERLFEEGPMVDAHSGRFTLRAIKIVADGALGSRGAALLEKYNDHESRGPLLVTEDELLSLLERALREGIQVQTHAIGDRANRFVLDLYSKAFDRVPPRARKIADPRWRIEHAQILHADDIPRFASLRVIPSMQPSHAVTDLHFAAARLGVERLAGAYAWRSLIDAGSIIAGGSDAPVEKGDPLVEFYAAVARRDLQGRQEGHWHPEQRVSQQQALKMLTSWAAYASFQEDSRGTIEAGKFADFTVLSQDILSVDEEAIPKTSCVMTIMGGEVVYER